MGGLSLWVRAEWRRRWAALLALALLVAVAGGVATALYAGSHRADTAFARFRQATSPYNLVASLRLGDEKPTSAAELEQRLAALRRAVADVADLDGVESVSVESWWAIRVYPELDDPGAIVPFAVGTASTYGMRYSPVVIDGALPSLDDGDAVTVNEHAARTLGWTVGSRHTFRTVSPAGLYQWVSNDATLASEDDLDGPEIDVEVVAVVRDEFDVADSRYPAIHFPEGFARAHADEISHLEPMALIRADPARISAVRQQIEAIVDPARMDVEEIPALGEVGAVVAPSVAVEVTTLRLAAAVAAAAGLFVVAQAVGRQIAAAAAEDNVRAALGITAAGRAAGKWLTLAPAALAGAAAVPIVAWAVSGAFPRGLARRAEAQPGLRFDADAIAAGATATLALTLVLLAVMAWRASQRDGRARSPRPSTGSRLLGRPVLSLGASFAADPAGAGRSRLGSWAPVAAVAMGVAAVLTVATLDSSRAHLTSSARLYGAAAELVYDSNGTFGLTDVVERAVATPGVQALTRQSMINDDTMAATGTRSAEVEPEAFETILGGARPPASAGRHPEGPDEVALGRATADDLGVGVGDQVTIAALDGSATLTLQVTGTVVSWGDDDATHAFIVTVPTLQALVCPGVGLDRCNLSVDVFADVADDAAGDTARATLIDDGFETIFPPASVARLSEVGAVPAYLAGFMCVLAAAGLLHQLTITSRRRRHDLAVARALGLPAHGAAAALTWQAMLTVVAGIAIGAAAGAVAGPLVWRIIADGLGVQVVTRLPVVVIPVAALVGAAVAVVLSLGPRLRAARLPLAATLRAE
jgi:ABC-type lipoprotein release transport system permease subunit